MSKTVVSVAEMAQMTGLGRARFYQLDNEGFAGIRPTLESQVTLFRPLIIHAWRSTLLLG